MSSRFQEAIDELVAEITAKEQEIVELKKTANFLRSRDGLDPLFDAVEMKSNPVGTGRGAVPIRPDQYYGKSPVTAAREYLEARGQAVLPDEIADALERGSFDYKAQGWNSKENRPRNLAISMSKNSGIFHRLPNGYYGLVKWYPDLAMKKKKPGSSPGASAEVEEAVEEAVEVTEEDQQQAE